MCHLHYLGISLILKKFFFKEIAHVFLAFPQPSSPVSQRTHHILHKEHFFGSVTPCLLLPSLIQVESEKVWMVMFIIFVL